MSDQMENVQPQEEQVEGGEQVESSERAEEQAVEDATHEPGARVEQTQDYEQAEAVESAVTEAMDNTEQAEPEPVEKDEGETGEPAQEERPAKTEAESAPEPRTESQEEVIAAEVEEPAPGDASEMVADEVEVSVAGEEGTVDRDESAMVDGSELSPASSEGVGDHSGEEATPINVPGPVANEPEPWPDPEPVRAADDGSELMNQATQHEEVVKDHQGTGGRPGDDVSATPINVPDEANVVDGGEGGRPGGGVSATPINLPREANMLEGTQDEQVAHVDHWSEVPEPGDDPPPPNLEADTYVETTDRLNENAEIGATPWIRVADDGSELMQEVGETPELGPEPFPQPLEEGMQVTEELESESDLQQEGDSEEEVPIEEDEGAEGTDEAPNWYLHEDSEGNVTVVDENGDPVDSPPKLVYFKGKYYAVYPGDDLPVKEDGTVTDPKKLAQYEISSYKPSTEGMKVYSGKDGTKVVDENGNPVESPPAVIQDPKTGKYYFVTESDPSKLSSLTKSGNFAAALSQGLIKEAPGYKPSTEGMKIYHDDEGNPTVVDENGKPVDSPPAVVQDPKTGKYYFVTESDPAKLSSFAKSGNFKDALAQGLIQEAPSYQPSTDGMKVYSGKDGTTVVDENGKPVESPPAVVQDPKTGKYYFVTETDSAKLSSFTKSGNFQDALSQGLIKEASAYQPSTDGMKVYSGKDGTTVVDENGKPVESPPAVIQDPKTGKYYFVTETDSAKLSSFTKSGNFQDALAQGLIKEASAYQSSTEGMKIYPDKDGNATVVDENGKPVESPPAVIQDPATGKYYFVTETDPAKLSSLAKGNFKDALAQGLIKEASTYQPSWWGKKSV